MRAWILHEPKPVEERPLALLDVETPVPAAGEVLIRVNACGICRTDLHVVEGDLPPRRRPVIPGHQIVGTVVEMGPGTSGPAPGDRVGVAWLHSTCGSCRFCLADRENLCERAEFTGWTRNGGFAEYMTAAAGFVYPLPGAIADHQVAPLLCAGIIGYRCLHHCGLASWSGARLGLYGFGAAGHIAIQIATARGAEVYVCTRDRERHQALAEELGAAWVGGAHDAPPVRLDASIIFAPAGEIVPTALAALDKGGTLVLGGIHMSPTPPLDYRLLYDERVIRSVANNTRADGRAFLDEAARARVHTHVECFDLEEVDRALLALDHDAIRGAGVIMIRAESRD